MLGHYPLVTCSRIELNIHRSAPPVQVRQPPCPLHLQFLIRRRQASHRIPFSSLATCELAPIPPGNSSNNTIDFPRRSAQSDRISMSRRYTSGTVCTIKRPSPSSKVKVGPDSDV